MSVPKFFEFFVPTLRALETKSPMTAKELYATLANAMRLTPEDMAEMVPSGRQERYKNRIIWATQYLKNAGLIVSERRGIYVITDIGKKALRNDADKIDLQYLEQFDSFIEFHKIPKDKPDGTVTKIDIAPEVTPLETMAEAHRVIHEELAKSLLTTIMNCSPDFFERLVVDLLLAMGYGYDSEGAGMVVGKTGDGGIDGIINEDKLGFSQVYVQAKRWDSSYSISRPDIQAFSGALLGKGATKGLYITTTKFTKSAREYAENLTAMRVVLVDGAELTRLMIDNGIGVSVQSTFTVKQIDGDYFENE